MKEIIFKRDEQKSIDIDYLVYKLDSYERNIEDWYPLIVFLHRGSFEENVSDYLKEFRINQYFPGSDSTLEYHCFPLTSLLRKIQEWGDSDIDC